MFRKIVDMYGKLSLNVKSSIYFMICNLFQKGIAFITVPIFTRIMSVNEYGKFTVFQSWLQIFIIFSSWNMAYGVINKALTKFEDHDDYISTIQLLYTFNTGIFIIIYYCIKYFIGNFLEMPFEIEILMFFELLFTPALAIFTVKSRYELKFSMAVILTLILTALNPILGILFVRVATEKGIARIYGYLLAQIIVCGPVYIWNFIRLKKIKIKEYWPYTIKFCLPLIPYFLSMIILNQSDKIMISKISGDSFAGIYSIAYSVAMLLKILNESINAAFVPWMYKKIADNSFLEIKNNITIIIVIVYLLNIFVILFIPEMMKIIVPEEYMDAIYMMPALTISVCFMFLSSIFSNLEMYYEHNSIIMKMSIVISLLNIILNYLFINKIGYFAAAYTTLFSYLFFNVLHIIYCKIYIKNISTFMNYKVLIILNIFMLIVSFIIPLIFNNIILRLFIAIILVTSLYKKSKYLKTKLKINLINKWSKNEN